MCTRHHNDRVKITIFRDVTPCTFLGSLACVFGAYFPLYSWYLRIKIEIFDRSIPEDRNVHLALLG